jgi:cytochrome c oxidase assembly protein subunit 11
MPSTPRLEQKNLRLAYRLAGVAVLFSALGFGMVPLYDVICKWTGINGKTNAQAVAAISNTQVDTSRWVTVQFLSHSMPGVGLDFKPEQFSMRVHPGEMVYTHYVVENMSRQAFVGQAIPSVTPANGASYLQKVECFCFNQQTFGPNEVRTLPIVFYISNDIDPNLGTVTLSYTFFEAVKEQASVSTNNNQNKL